MSNENKFTDDPIIDTSQGYQKDQRSNLANSPAIAIESLKNEDLSGIESDVSAVAVLHARKRRKENRDTSQSEVDDSDAPRGVMFLLGENAVGEGGEEQTHNLFCELDELCDPDGKGELEWRETARWIKFEEDVEENGERWSKPHVATVSLLSLFQVRSCLDKAIIMFNLEANNIEQISDLVLEKFVDEGMLPDEFREITKEILLKRHHHLHNRLKNKFIGKSATNLPIIRSLADIGKRYSSKEVDKETHLTANKSSAMLGNDLDQNQTPADNPNQPDMSAGKYDYHFMKKIPAGAETSNILVGETDYLRQPICAFIRLKDAFILGEMTEVPVPTRFIFIFLQPRNQNVNSKEVGRAMATLMSDEVFHDIAYRARNKRDILTGLDEFLSSSTVLPPGEWDPKIRIEPPSSVPSQETRKIQQNLSVEKNLGHSDSLLLAKGDAHAKSINNGSDPPEGGSGPGSHTGEDHEDADGHGDDPALQRTGKIFGGLIADVKRRLPHYPSDIKDAIHPQTFGSFFFIYFACLAPIITFGGLLSQETGGYLGTMESIMSGLICGVAYAIFSGQPLTVLGSTGPVLIFEKIVYGICKSNGWNYLSFRLWIGIWTFVLLMIMVAFDLSSLVKFITRFTEESFATLIAIIFIFKAIEKLIDIKEYYPVNPHWTPEDLRSKANCNCELNINENDLPTLLNGSSFKLSDIPLGPDNKINATAITEGLFSWKGNKFAKLCLTLNGTLPTGCKKFYTPDVFFFSCLIFLASFIIAYKLKNIKSSILFPSKVRSVISDFAVMISITACTLTDYFIGFRTPKLTVPSSFQPTLGYEARSWIVYPFDGNPWYTALIAFGPSLLSTILIFMDQQITAVIINRKENKLTKGAGYHLDLLVVALTILSNSILGIPWFVAATVLSINHVISLKKESESAAPGEKPVFLGCREQRVTAFLVFLLIGLSVFMTPLLKHIPMPVLYGIFLFMGISSLNSVQLVQRIFLFLIPVKYQPDYPFLRHVPLRRVHLFTIIQVFCFILLYVIKTIQIISITFPLMVLALCFIRKLLDYIFTQHELKWLDDILPGSKMPAKKSYTGFDSLPLKNVPSSEKILSISTEVPKTNIWKSLDNQIKTRKKPKGRKKRESEQTDHESSALIDDSKNGPPPQIRFTINQPDDNE